MDTTVDRPKMHTASRLRHRIWDSEEDTHSATIGDLLDAIRRWPLWSRLAWQDVLLRYRRSLLGPFWLTLSMGFMVSALAVVYGDLFGISLSDFLPYLTVSLLTWGLIQSSIAEGCQSFIEGEWIIKQINLPLIMFPFRVVTRNLIIFAHNVVIYVVVVLTFRVPVGWHIFIAAIGLLLLTINAIWWSTLLGMLAARFRDLPQIVSSVLQVAFLATPVIWRPNLINNKALIYLNPFYYYLEIVRGPMLGQTPPIHVWIVVVILTVVGIIATSIFFHRRRSRLPFWV